MKSIYVKYKEIINYLVFGGLSFVLNIVLYYILEKILPINILVINVIDWILIVAFCFVTNKLFVFEDKSKNNMLFQIIKFYAGRLITLVLEEIILFIGITKLEFNSLIIKIVAQVIVIVTNYIISKILIFNRKE